MCGHEIKATMLAVLEVGRLRREASHPCRMGIAMERRAKAPRHRHDLCKEMVVIPLFAHQEQAVQFGMMMPRAYLNMDCGTGKTRVALELIKRKKAKALVIAPLTLIETSWRGDWERFGYGESIVFSNARVNKKKTLSGTWNWDGANGTNDPHDAVLMITNPESFIRTSSYDAPWIDTLIIDEASKLKNRTTKISKAVYEMSKRVKSVYLLSGNPCPNGPEEWWSQMRCIDPSVLGESWWSFLGKYGYKTGYMKHEWKPYKEKLPELMGRISRVTFRVTKEEALDLPPQTFTVRQFELGKEERAAYDALKRDKILELKAGTVLAANILTEVSKLRQISSGFVLGLEGHALQLGKAKLDTLRDVLEEIGPQQVVIFSQWREEIRQIKEVLGEQAGCVYGGENEAAKADAIRSFQMGKLRYLICHPRSGGHGLNLQSASYIIWSSLSYSLEEWDQANARIHRSGQSKPCTHITLQAKDTIDQAVYAALKKKAKVSEALLEMLK